jgi:hypothetical protein
MKITLCLATAAFITAAPAVKATEYRNEIKFMEGHTKSSHVVSPLPHTYLAEDDIPDNWNWDNVGGKSYLTKGDPYGHPSHEVTSLRIFGSRKSWARRWNGLDE